MFIYRNEDICKQHGAKTEPDPYIRTKFMHLYMKMDATSNSLLIGAKTRFSTSYIEQNAVWIFLGTKSGPMWVVNGHC